MENLKNRIENWQKSEMSKDEGNASSVWQFNRKSFNHKNGGSFRGYGLNLKKKNLVEYFKFFSDFPENSKFYFSPKFGNLDSFGCFWKITKMRAPKFHAEWSGFHAEISHMRPIQGQKLKLEIDHFPDPLKN